MLGHLRPDDAVVVWKLDRLSRSLKEFLLILEKIEGAKASFKSLAEAVDTGTPAGRMMMHIIGSFAEFERAMLKERTKSGLDAARKEGRIGGRKPKLSDLQRKEIVALVSSGQKTAAEAARLFAISPATVSRMIAGTRSSHKESASPAFATILLSLRIDNNSKFVHGKKRVVERIENLYLKEFQARQPSGDYLLKVPYKSDKDLDISITELLSDIANDAEDQNCFSESEARLDGSDRCW
ncbi:MAG: hypothetical protein RL095_1169 [Verrucomicrobiota bacterium]|jgi:transposase-like protein